jgi:hypothetical protein
MGRPSATFVLAVEPEAVGDLVNLLLVPTSLGVRSFQLSPQALQMLGLLAVHLLYAESQCPCVVLLELVHRRAVQDDRGAGDPRDARPVHRRELRRAVPALDEELSPLGRWRAREAQRLPIERAPRGAVVPWLAHPPFTIPMILIGWYAGSGGGPCGGVGAARATALKGRSGVFRASSTPAE